MFKKVAGTLVAIAPMGAFAAIPTEVDAAFTTLLTDSGAMILKGWPVVVAITVGFILVKLFKKTANKAT